MSPAERDREQAARRRLEAYAERQIARAAAYDRLVTATGSAAHLGIPIPAQPEPPATGSEPTHHPSHEPAEVTIVVPVHDAPEQLHACLWSVARNTTRPARVMLIDDASTDPQIEYLLAWAADLENVVVLRNTQNLGFPATVNRGLRAARGDVVLLNSDTEVGPRWLEQLTAAAYSTPVTGSATPLSDNAGAFSAPELDTANAMPVWLSPDDVARLTTAAARAPRPRAPTGNGFCLYLRRALIDAVGEMNVASFPRGYGEETDYCMRAGRLGWQHVVDGHTFVHHRRAASFGAERTRLVESARRRMAELHPDYPSEVTRFIADDDMRTARGRVAQALERGASHGPPRPRLLFVVHRGGGGAVATNRDLMGALGSEYECYCFSSDRHVLRLEQIEGADSDVLQEWPLERPLLLGEFSRPDYRAAFSAALDRVAPELVHIRHLFKHTFDPPRLAAARELPVVMSFHDHYFICPTIHLLDERGDYCGGRCTPSAGHCPTVRAGSLPPLKHAFVYQWREEVDLALTGVDAFVTTSTYTRDMHRRFLGAARGRFELIEHGRDLLQLDSLADPPEPGGRIRILVPGHLNLHKGADLLAALARLDRGRRLELHLAGDVPARYRNLGVNHGPYERDDLAARVREIQPAFVGVFSVTGESYCHTITEAWAAGVPVLATDLGAQASRVRAHGGGFVISADDPPAALRQILAAADDPAAYAREQRRATIASLPTVADMASRYADLYRDVIDSRRPVAAPAGRRSSPLARGVWRLAVPASAPDSALARRLTHPSLRWKLRARLDDAEDADLVVADLKAPEGLELAERLRGRGSRLILMADGPPADGEVDEGEEALLEAGRLVIVPSPQLANLFSRRHGRVEVLAPALDERLFLDATAQEPPLAPAPAPLQDVRLAYVDPRPGTDELTLLRTALQSLRSETGRSYALDVVTSREPEMDAGWYEWVRMPDPALAYVDYARRLGELRARWHVAVLPRVTVADGDLRYLECAALGLPTVQSATEESSVRDGVEALVCENDAEAWAGAIERLTTDVELAQTIRQEAWRDIVTGRLMRQSVSPLLELLGQALDAPLPATAVTHAA